MNKKTMLLPSLWLVVVLALLAYNAFIWLDVRLTPNTNIVALLPVEQQDPVLQQAFAHLIDSAEERVIVLIGGGTWPQTRQAAQAYNAVIKTRPDVFTTMSTATITPEMLDVFFHDRAGLLTSEDRRALHEKSPDYWFKVALSRIYDPFSGMGLSSWQDDPFGFYSNWIVKHLQSNTVRPRDGLLSVDNAQQTYAVLLLNLRHSAFLMETQAQVLPLLARARAAVGPHVSVLSAGLVLHAAATGHQASQEMATIGLGSLLGILLLMWLTFASLRPILLIALSLGVGALAAIAVCYTVFGQIHALTLVFGMSLIGIAQDYAIYFICSRMSVATNLDSYQLRRRLMPGLSLTLVTALIGYLGLALTSFSGLRQMAVFSGAGLIAAWLTVVCWLPLFVKASSFRVTRLGRWVSEAQWPTQWRINKCHRLIALMLVTMAIIWGLSRLTVNDDIRILKKTPANLQHDQITINHWLNIPSSLQFYLVRGATPQNVLEREEQLSSALAPLVAAGVITGTQAVSDWVPSLQRQAADQRLVANTLWTDHGVLQHLSLFLGTDDAWLKRMQTFDHPSRLTPEALLNTPLSQTWRYLWLGKVDHTYASIVTLRGFTISAIPSLQTIRVPGVQWVDKVASTSLILGNYRHSMSWVIVGAYAVIYAALFLRYRIRAWRIMAPPTVASLVALAFFGISGLPLQLFHVLALLLILGIGVDYGVFMNEQVDQRFAKLTVALSALSALLSFGLLALSHTPPLHAFGLTMALGLALVWLLAPLLNTYWRMK